MWEVALRDLVWRRRRYLVSLAGTALVFAVSLAVTGISDAFPVEVERTFDALGAEVFVVPEGVAGPLTGSQPFDPAQLPEGTAPMAYLIQSADPEDPQMVATFGLEPGRSEPQVSEGRQLSGPDDALVGDAAGLEVGDPLEISGRRLEVVGVVDDLSLNAGMAGVVVPLATFQQAFLGGSELVMAGIGGPTVDDVPEGFRMVDRDEAREDALRILADATSTINLVKVLLWVVAALIVGSVLFVSVTERTTEVAVLKAIGTATRSLAGGIALQAAVLAGGSAVVGVLLALVIAPLFPMPVELSWVALAGLPAVGVVVGLGAVGVALRRAVRIEPALAFGGSA